MDTHSTSSSPEMFLSLKRTESTFDEIPVMLVPRMRSSRPRIMPEAEEFLPRDIKAAWGSDPTERQELAELIRDACINVGFFYIKNHGIPDDIIDKTVEAGKAFFALPEEVKMEIDIHKTANFKGYTALLGENTDSKGRGDLHEGFDLGWEPSPDDTRAPSTQLADRSDGAMHGQNVWPKDLPGFKNAAMEYYRRVSDVGKSLFPIFALALDLPEDFFNDKTRNPGSIMRLLYYPPQPPTQSAAGDDGKQIGIGAHTDYECFTILWQDRAAGLQVQNTAGHWVDAVPIPGTLVVNLGDQFARWTNDIFKSTIHRVVNHSGIERYSIPMFIGTDYDVLLEPIPTCVSPGAPSKYEVITAGEYVKSRLEATYAHSAVP